MDIDLAFFVALVDADVQFVNYVAIELRPRLRERHPTYEVRGYGHAEELFHDIDVVNSLSVPKVVVADSAARTPSVKDGVFSRLKQPVPRCWPIFYSSTMEGRDELDRLSIRHSAVRREWGDGIQTLAEAVFDDIRLFEESAEREVISEFLEAAAKSTHPYESSVDADDGGLSPVRMLIDVCRGNENGKALIKDMFQWRRNRPGE